MKKYLTPIKCDLCGNCCKRKGDYIPLTVFDLIRMSRGYDKGKINKKIEFRVRMGYIGSIGDVMPKDKFLYQYSLLVEGWVPLPYLKLPCIYLNGSMCSIQSYKPLICISFPYHLPVWKQNDPCYLIRELSSRKKEGKKIIIPNESEKAIHLYPIALSATMYQLNLPIYSLNISQNRLILKGGFRDLVDNSKEFKAKVATSSQVSNWVSKHFTTFRGIDSKLEEIKLRLKSTLLTAIDNPEFQLSNISLIQKLSIIHFTSRLKIRSLINYFLTFK